MESKLGCRTWGAKSEWINEMCGGQTLWKGQVETLSLRDHPLARRAYAWEWKDAACKIHTIVVLSVPPINSPAEAVRASIAVAKLE